MLIYRFIVFNDLDNNINSWVNIGYIASYLEHNKNAEVQFQFYKSCDVSKAIQEVCENPPEVVGLPMLQHNFNEILSFCREIKKRLPQLFIVLGNKEAVCYYEYIMTHYPEVDAIVLGEGEVTTNEMCYRLSRGETLVECPGLVVRTKEHFVMTGSRFLVQNLDELPFPSRKYRVGDSNIYNIIGSRGCVGRCSFCEANTIFEKNLCTGSSVRYRSIDNILDEVAELMGENKFVVINFLDSTFCSNNKHAILRLQELYNQIVERKLNFQFNLNVRSDQVNDEFIKKLKQLSTVGLDSILVGIETGNADDVKIYNKGPNLEHHINAIKLLNKALKNDPNFIGVEYGFINFNPFSTIEKLKANAEFATTYNVTLYPFDIMSKLRLSGSTKITQQVAEAGLLRQDIKKPITDPYAYDFIDDRMERLYCVLERAYSFVKFANTSLLLSKLRRYSMHATVDIEILEKVIEMNRQVGYITIQIFEKALFIVENSLPAEQLFRYAKEQNDGIKECSKQLKGIENRVSIDLAKLQELPYFS